MEGPDLPGDWSSRQIRAARLLYSKASFLFRGNLANSGMEGQRIISESLRDPRRKKEGKQGGGEILENTQQKKCHLTPTVCHLRWLETPTKGPVTVRSKPHWSHVCLDNSHGPIWNVRRWPEGKVYKIEVVREEQTFPGGQQWQHFDSIMMGFF